MTVPGPPAGDSLSYPPVLCPKGPPSPAPPGRERGEDQQPTITQRFPMYKSSAMYAIAVIAAALIVGRLIFAGHPATWFLFLSFLIGVLAGWWIRGTEKRS